MCHIKSNFKFLLKIYGEIFVVQLNLEFVHFSSSIMYRCCADVHKKDLMFLYVALPVEV